MKVETASSGLMHGRPITIVERVCRQSLRMRFDPMRLVEIENRLFTYGRVVETG